MEVQNLNIEVVWEQLGMAGSQCKRSRQKCRSLTSGENQNSTGYVVIGSRYKHVLVSLDGKAEHRDNIWAVPHQSLWIHRVAIWLSQKRFKVRLVRNLEIRKQFGQCLGNQNFKSPQTQLMKTRKSRVYQKFVIPVNK